MDTELVSDAQLLEQIEGFCAAHKLSPTTFGRMSVSDGSLIPNLRAGRSLTLKTANKVVEFMRDYQPDAEPARAA